MNIPREEPSNSPEASRFFIKIPRFTNSQILNLLKEKKYTSSSSSSYIPQSTPINVKMVGRRLRSRNDDKNKDEEKQSETNSASSVQQKPPQSDPAKKKTEKEKAILPPAKPAIATSTSAAGSKSRPVKKPPISDAKVNDEDDDDAPSSALSDLPSTAPSQTPVFPNLTTKKSDKVAAVAKSAPAQGKEAAKPKPKAKAAAKEGPAKSQAQGAAAKPKVKAPAKSKDTAQAPASKPKTTEAALAKQPAPKSEPQAAKAKATVKANVKAPAKELVPKSQARAASAADKKGKGKGKAAQEAENEHAATEAEALKTQLSLPPSEPFQEEQEHERPPSPLRYSPGILTRNPGSQSPPASHCSTPPLRLAPLPGASTFPPSSPSEHEHEHEQERLTAGILMQMSSEEDPDKAPTLWLPSENNPRCPRCVRLIEGGAGREDVRCFGGPPCVQCEGEGVGGEECRGGYAYGGLGAGDEGEGRAKKRARVV